MMRQLLTCALAALSVSAVAAPLRSPWDALPPVAITAAPYACPVIPAIPADLTTDGFYRLDDPTHSIIDPLREAAYKASAQPVKDAGLTIVNAADAFRATGSRAAAQCVIDRAFTLAQANSIAGKMSSSQAFYVQGWVAGAIAIAYLKVRPTELATPDQNKTIAAWLLRVNHSTQGYYERRNKSNDAGNNHLYWAGIESTAIGTVADDRPAFDWGIHTYKVGVAQIRPDGTLPLEMARGARALHYHLYALAPLVLLAEFGETNGDDLYALDKGAIQRLVKVSVAGLVDPTPFQQATHTQQDIAKVPSGDQIGWAPPYLRRFSNADLARFVANAPTLSVYYLGGLPPQ